MRIHLQNPPGETLFSFSEAMWAAAADRAGPAGMGHSVSIGKTAKDFTVTPYLQLTDFETSVQGTNLTMKIRLKAPKRVGLPNIVEIKPYLSLTEFVGESSFINIGEYNNRRIQINRSWMAEVGDVETSNVYTIGPLPVKSGYTYNVRVGANVNDANRKYNYSEIKEVIVP